MLVTTQGEWKTGLPAGPFLVRSGPLLEAGRGLWELVGLGGVGATVLLWCWAVAEWFLTNVLYLAGMLLFLSFG